MPSRSSPGSLSGSSIRKNTNVNGVTSVVFGPSSFGLNWTNSVTYGNNIPGWREKLRQGQNVTTSLSGTHIEARFTPGHINAKRPKTGLLGTDIYMVDLVGGNGINVIIPSANPASLNDSSANAAALGKFAQRAYQLQTAIQGGVVLGELAQTIRMIKNPAVGLRRQVDEFRDIASQIRRRQRGPSIRSRIKTATENLADAWLEAQFGWKPFMSDIRNGAEALERYNTGHGVQTRRITARHTTSSSPAGSTGVFAQSFFAWKRKSHQVSKTEVIYRGAIRLQAKDPRSMDPALIGFDLSSWAPTVWELIPYSFLIDYFSNIGDVIVGWSNLGIQLSWCNRTSRKTIEYTDQTVPHPNWGGYAVSHAPAKYFCAKRSVSRATYTGTLVPDVDFEIPDLGSKKWLNIAALIASRNADRKWFYD